MRRVSIQSAGHLYDLLDALPTNGNLDSESSLNRDAIYNSIFQTECEKAWEKGKDFISSFKNVFTPKQWKAICEKLFPEVERKMQDRILKKEVMSAADFLAVLKSLYKKNVRSIRDGIFSRLNEEKHSSALIEIYEKQAWFTLRKVFTENQREVLVRQVTLPRSISKSQRNQKRNVPDWNLPHKTNWHHDRRLRRNSPNLRKKLKSRVYEPKERKFPRHNLQKIDLIEEGEIVEDNSSQVSSYYTTTVDSGFTRVETPVGKKKSKKSETISRKIRKFRATTSAQKRCKLREKLYKKLSKPKYVSEIDRIDPLLMRSIFSEKQISALEQLVAARSPSYSPISDVEEPKYEPVSPQNSKFGLSHTF
jgi:hypothetical protein